MIHQTSSMFCQILLVANMFMIIVIGQSRNYPECFDEIKYEKSYDVEWNEEFETVCETKYKYIAFYFVFIQKWSYWLNLTIFRNQCKTRFEQVCSPKQEKVCQTKYVEKCQSLSKSNCYTAYKESPYEDTECNDKYVAECPQEWKISGAGVKVWTPDTSKCFNLVSKVNNNQLITSLICYPF